MENKVIKGGDNIADIIKMQANDIPHLQKEHGLPVWKLGGKGPWRSTLVLLLEWANKMAKTMGNKKPVNP